MPYLIALGVIAVIAGFVGYVIIIGIILIWPLFNLLAYLNVLVFPSKIRKKYGTDLESIDFSQEVTNDDMQEIKNLEKLIKTIKEELKTKLNRLQGDLGLLTGKLNKLNPSSLKKNKDGTFSLRSKAGKEATNLSQQIYSVNSKIENEREFSSKREKKTREDIIHIKNKPWDAWRLWKGRYVRYLGNRSSLVFMLIGFPIFFYALTWFEFEFLGAPKFSESIDMYVFYVFVGPVLNFFDTSIFNGSIYSMYISVDYATDLQSRFAKNFAIGSWATVTLPMPVLTLLWFSGAASFLEDEAKKIEPKKFE